MRVRLSSLLVVPLLVTATGCWFLHGYQAQYLFRAEARSEAGRMEGPARVGDIGHRFRDDRLVATWRVTDDYVHVELVNRSAGRLLFDWDAAAWHDHELGRDALFASRHWLKVRRPRAVGPGDRVSFQVYPLSRVSVSESGERYREQGGPFGRTAGSQTPERTLENAAAHLGRSFEVELPIDWGDARRTYRFRFLVEDVRAKAIRGAPM